MMYLVINRPKRKYQGGMTSICVFVEAKNPTQAKKLAREIEAYDPIYYTRGLSVFEVEHGQAFFL